MQTVPIDDSDQTARIHKLIWIFAGRTYPNVRFWRSDWDYSRLIEPREGELILYTEQDKRWLTVGHITVHNFPIR